MGSDMTQNRKGTYGSLTNRWVLDKLKATPRIQATYLRTREIIRRPARARKLQRGWNNIAAVALSRREQRLNGISNAAESATQAL